MLLASRKRWRPNSDRWTACVEQRKLLHCLVKDILLDVESCASMLANSQDTWNVEWLPPVSRMLYQRLLYAGTDSNWHGYQDLLVFPSLGPEGSGYGCNIILCCCTDLQWGYFKAKNIWSHRNRIAYSSLCNLKHVQDLYCRALKACQSTVLHDWEHILQLWILHSYIPYLLWHLYLTPLKIWCWATQNEQQQLRHQIRQAGIEACPFSFWNGTGGKTRILDWKQWFFVYNC